MAKVSGQSAGVATTAAAPLAPRRARTSRTLADAHAGSTEGGSPAPTTLASAVTSHNVSRARGPTASPRASKSRPREAKEGTRVKPALNQAGPAGAVSGDTCTVPGPTHTVHATS